jgi:hypothetical protein
VNIICHDYKVRWEIRGLSWEHCILAQ